MPDGTPTPGLRLVLRPESPRRLAGAAVLVNDGPTEARVWRSGSHWGDRILSFEAAGPSGVTVTERAPVRYTRDVPAGQAVPAGGEHAMPFDLGDGTWRPEVPPDATSLTAVLDVPDSPEARLEGVWTGRLRSNPIPLG